jgi:hypothetical protein
MLISDDAGTSTTQIDDDESGNATKVPATTITSAVSPSTTVSSTSPATTTEPKQTTTTQPSATTTPDVVTEEPGTYSGGFESEEPARA